MIGSMPTLLMCFPARTQPPSAPGLPHPTHTSTHTHTPDSVRHARQHTQPPPDSHYTLFGRTAGARYADTAEIRGRGSGWDLGRGCRGESKGPRSRSPA
eukprot:3880561-Rhodomonas_salina.1